jgi:hypothetical protein
VPLCAIVVSLGACLNPIPDDFPNQQGDSDGVDDFAPDRPGSDIETGGPGEADGEGAPPSPAPSQGAADPNAPDAGDAGAPSVRSAVPRPDAGHDGPDAGVCSGAVP